MGKFWNNGTAVAVDTKTDLPYIDAAFLAAARKQEADAALTAEDRKEIALKAVKPIAGFHVTDKDMETKMLEERLEKRRETAKIFQTDRTRAAEALEKKGILALAILPTSSWVSIVKRTGLYRLQTDAHGRVAIQTHKLRGYRKASEFEYVAKTDWPHVIDLLFPTKNSVDNHDSYAILVMPEPPEEVACVLLKAQGLSLKVATVADAIGFKETPAQLWAREQARVQEEIRYREWLRTDPIVYTEMGTATAIIAQFGDFPIEKQVVDEIAGTEHLVITGPEEPMWDPTGIMMRQAGQQSGQNSGIMWTAGGAGGGGGGSGGGGGGGSGGGLSQNVFNSEGWTGR